MTRKDQVKQKQPERVQDTFCGGVEGCPHHYEYLNVAEEDEYKFCQDGAFINHKTCTVCWNQKYKEEEHG